MLLAQRMITFLKFKMASAASRMSGEEVLVQIMADSCGENCEMDDSEDDTCVESNEKDDSDLDTKINRCLEAFDSFDLGGNIEAFKKCIESFIKASVTVFQPPSDPMKVLLNRSVNCVTIFEAESKQWLRKIYSRLGGKVSIRHPYQGEIVRCLPLEIFLALKTSVQHSRRREITNNVVYSDNKHQHVMSFSSRKAVIEFLSLLSCWPESDVKSCLKKSLAGRVHGIARVIVSCAKEFSLTYKIKSGQFCVSFYYGVWNKAGFPLHNF